MQTIITRSSYTFVALVVAFVTLGSAATAYAWGSDLGHEVCGSCGGGSSSTSSGTWNAYGGAGQGGSSSSSSNETYTPPVVVPVVIPAPTCSLTAAPASLTLASGMVGASTLSWTTTNATSASIATLGSVALTGSHGVAVSATTTYVMTVTGRGGTRTCEATVTVARPVTPAPTCTLGSANDTIQYGQSTMLSWTTANATSATLTTFGSVVTAGSYSIFPAATTTYTLTVTGQGGTTTCTKTVTVTPAPAPTAPSCTLTASNESIQQGQATTLSWNSSNATSVSLSTIGSVATNGSYSVAPSTTTTYVLTVTGQGGTTTCTKTVGVTSAPVYVPPTYNAPSCSLYANQSTVQHGGSTTLYWNSNDAYSASIDAVGSVATNGSYTVQNIYGTRTFTMTVVGQGGTRTCQATVYAQAPVVQYTNYPTYTPAPAPVYVAPQPVVEYVQPALKPVHVVRENTTPVRSVHTQVALARVPYTGAEDYMMPLFLFALALSAAYTFTRSVRA